VPASHYFKGGVRSHQAASGKEATQIAVCNLIHNLMGIELPECQTASQRPRPAARASEAPPGSKSTPPSAEAVAGPCWAAFGGLVLPCSRLATISDCGWSLLNHGVADIKRLNLGNLNPIYERELTKLEVHQG
jgi:hypothetical protein